MTRRDLLNYVLATSAWVMASGHAPYNQWRVYRQAHLLILTHKQDPASFLKAKKLAAMIAQRLPDSRAQVSLAPDRQRVASLIASRQIEVALLTPDEARDLNAGEAPMAGAGPVPIRVIASFGDYVLVGHAAFPEHHAYLLAEAIAGLGAELAPELRLAGSAGAAADLAGHPGALAFEQGQKLPELSAEPAAPATR